MQSEKYVEVSQELAQALTAGGDFYKNPQSYNVMVSTTVIDMMLDEIDENPDDAEDYIHLKGQLEDLHREVGGAHYVVFRDPEEKECYTDTESVA